MKHFQVHCRTIITSDWLFHIDGNQHLQAHIYHSGSWQQHTRQIHGQFGFNVCTAGLRWQQALFSGADMWPRCAHLDRSMKICPRGYLRVLISKIARTRTSLQWFMPKNYKFKMPTRNHFMVHKSAVYAPITTILMSVSMFLGQEMQ